MNDSPELHRYLLEELADRLDDHPMREWSSPLIRAVLVSMDMFPKVGRGPGGGGGPGGLRLVR
ncbi:hypothetical protein A5718_21940 [Mycolicibacterium conceptionense]|nr:hypothetical protein A5718_21940 [Mycolicibacterium conceptionense]